MKSLNITSDISIIRAFVVSSMIMLTFFWYNITENMNFAYAGITIMALSVFFLPPLECFLVALSLAPHIRMIRIIGNPLALQGYYLFFVQLKYFLFRHIKMRPIFAINLVLAIFTAVMWNEISLFPMALRGIVYLTFIYTIFSYSLDKKYIDSIFIFYLFGMVISQLFSVYYTVTNAGTVFTGDLSSLNNDRNYNAALVAGGVAISIVFLIYRKYKIPYIAVTLFLFFTGMLSGSRTYFLSMFFVLILLLSLQAMGEIKQRRVIMVFVFIVAALIVLYLPVFIDRFDEILFSRFRDDDVYSGNGRIEGWKYYLSLTFSSIERMFLGSGSATNYLKGPITQVEHNTYVQSIFTFGMLGFLTLLMCYYKISKRILSGKRYRLWHFLPLLCTLFCFGSVSALYSGAFDSAFLMSVLSAKYLSTQGYQITT